MPKLRVIFFDIDDTLYSTTDFTRKARYNAIDAMRKAGLKIGREACYRILMEIVNEFTSNDSHHFDKLMKRLPEEATRGINRLITVAAGISGYHNTKFTALKPFPDVARYMPRIARLPMRCGIISAGLGPKQAEKLVRLGLARHFDPALIFITEEVGIGKINRNLFDYACEHAGVAPSAALYVGDNPATDVDIAHAAGLVTVLREGAGRHAHDAGRTAPDHHIRDFNELCGILAREYGLRCGKTGLKVGRSEGRKA